MHAAAYGDVESVVGILSSSSAHVDGRDVSHIV